MFSVGLRENTRTRRKGMIDLRVLFFIFCVNLCKFVQLSMKLCCLLIDDDSLGCSIFIIILIILFCREYIRFRFYFFDVSIFIFIFLSRVYQFLFFLLFAYWLVFEYKVGVVLIYYIKNYCRDILIRVFNFNGNFKWNFSILLECK